MAKATPKTETKPVPPEVADPFNGMIKVLDEDLTPKEKPIPKSVLDFAASLNERGKVVLSVAAWTDEAVKTFTGIVRKNARSLFPGKRVRIVPGTTSQGPALKFSLGALGERKPKVNG